MSTIINLSYIAIIIVCRFLLKYNSNILELKGIYFTGDIMTSIYIFFCVLILISLLIFKSSKCFFKALFTSVIGGVGAICAVSALSTFVPISICVNWLTLGISAFFSVPGVIMLLLINTFCV